jgi:hypothetical protein
VKWSATWSLDVAAVTICCATSIGGLLDAPSRPRSSICTAAKTPSAKLSMSSFATIAATRGIFLKTMIGSGSLPLAVVASSALCGLGHLGSDMTAENALFVFLFTFVGGSMYALAYLRTGSLYAAILAHVIANTAASLRIAVPPEGMSWVDVALVELCCLACLPLLFAASRRIRLGLIARNAP